jgi:hypothetical protein
MSRFILFRGTSLYGSVDRMLDNLAAAFQAEGDEIVIIEAAKADYIPALQRAVSEGVDGFIGFTGIGLDLREENNLYNTLDLPLASIYLDPLLLYWSQVETPIKRRVIFTTAPDDVDYWGERASAPVRHMPHAAHPVSVLVQTPWARRKIPLLFSGTGPEDPEALRAGWASHGEAVQRRLNDILDAHDKDPLAPLIPVIAQIAHPVARLDEPDTLYPYFVTLDIYLRARARWRTALALMALPALFIGPGWEPVVAANQGPMRATLVGEQPAHAVIEQIGQAKLVVNTCTPYHGSHERLFQAMAQRAVAFTTETSWLRHLAPEGSVAQFRAGAEDIAHRAEMLLEPDSVAEAIAEDGYRWLSSTQTWRDRARSIKVGLMQV